MLETYADPPLVIFANALLDEAGISNISPELMKLGVKSCMDVKSCKQLEMCQGIDSCEGVGKCKGFRGCVKHVLRQIGKALGR